MPNGIDVCAIGQKHSHHAHIPLLTCIAQWRLPPVAFEVHTNPLVQHESQYSFVTIGDGKMDWSVTVACLSEGGAFLM